ncbi:hypothetical protein DESUT3_05290 [Desulfuromonas versatilis]|uniref:TadE-like domain-containing protein n=1 Tax=Desulfuromonas versatilis TaxID=2802975 RepID=A0ABM9SDG5_9BACT|nr:TadE family protein [Desulfuromonas versatilis]BCR03460.1 hypothetical protein DESUT3_05290 [Desulfuromonas versatilis]
MTRQGVKTYSGTQRGAVIVELAMVLPLLLLLVYGIADYAQAIQAKNILINISREGANLASRTSSSPLDIMSALATTAQPLEMARRGRMYITRVEGRDGGPRVTEQYLWPGGYPSSSRVWGECGRWLDGACEMPDQLPTANLDMDLANGEVVFAVEVFYSYQPLIGYVLQNTSELYSITLF